MGELRSDWTAGERRSLIVEVRWRRAKAWRSKGLEYLRGVACEMRVAKDAHERLLEIWTRVRGVDAVVPEIARQDLGDSTKWGKGTSAAIVGKVALAMRTAGVVEGGPVWIAADRAAAKACQRWRLRVEAYGWGRPIAERDLLPTLRLPFGEHYGEPLTRDDETHWTDRTLLGEFEAVGAGDEPGTCAYAECSLLPRGWAIRFVTARIAETKTRAGKSSANEASPPAY